jgi:hypothetical protein
MAWLYELTTEPSPKIWGSAKLRGFFFNLSSNNPSGFGSVVHNIVKLIMIDGRTDGRMDGWMVSSYFLDMHGLSPKEIIPVVWVF